MPFTFILVNLGSPQLKVDYCRKLKKASSVRRCGLRDDQPMGTNRGSIVWTARPCWDDDPK